MISRAVAFSLTTLSLGLCACVGDTPGTQPVVDSSAPNDTSPPSDSGAGETSVDSSDAAPSCPTTAAYEWHHPGPDGSSSAIVTTDDAGNTLAISNYGGAIDFGKGPLLNNGSGEVAVVKLDPSGTLVWSTSFSGAGSDRANAIATDSAGDVYVVGTSSSTSMDINAKGQNALAFNSNGGSGFVVKLKGKDGGYLWAEATSSTKFAGCNAVAVAGTHVAVGCTFSSVIDLSAVCRGVGGRSNARGDV